MHITLRFILALTVLATAISAATTFDPLKQSSGSAVPSGLAPSVASSVRATLSSVVVGSPSHSRSSDETSKSTRASDTSSMSGASATMSSMSMNSTSTRMSSGMSMATSLAAGASASASTTSHSSAGVRLEGKAVGGSAAVALLLLAVALQA
ncbi:hypothetical protein ACM66B_006072 [Microbotryomycetes sp. NB124-2]